MKRYHLLAVALILCQMLSAQIFQKVEVKEVECTQCEHQRMAALSEDGQWAYLTSPNNKGLSMLHLQTGECRVVTTDEGAGFQPVVSRDGMSVMHRSTHFDEKRLRRTALKLVDMEEKDTRELAKPARELSGYAMANGLATVVSNGEQRIHKVRPQQGVAPVSKNTQVYIEDMQLMVARNGKSMRLSPNGVEEVSYLWPSLSPDGTKILYYVCDEGTYVCDLNGENVQFISFDCRAPRWYDDNTIIGMNDRDDDTHFTASSIVAFTLDGARQELTDEGLILMYPFCSAEAGRIVCSSARGGVYMLNIKK